MVYWYLSIFTELLRLMRLFMQWPEWRRGISVRVLAGMNLAMLLETAAMRASSSLQELVAIAEAAGRDGISEPLVVKEEENGEDY